MSWKADIHTALQQLAQDIRNIRESLGSGECVAEIGPLLGEHISQLIDAISNLDEIEYKNLVEGGDAVKKSAIPLIQSITGSDKEKIKKQIGDLTAQVRKLNEANKNTPDTKKTTIPKEKKVVATTNVTSPSNIENKFPTPTKIIDLEAVRKLVGNIKETLLEINRANKGQDQKRSNETMQSLVDQCKLLCALGTESGCDMKKFIRVALRKVESVRVASNGEELQEVLKEFHKAIKEVEKKYKAHNDQKPKKTVVKKPQSAIEVELSDLNKELVKDDPTDLFTLTSELGKGATGSVHKAVAKNKKVFAIKRVPLTMKTLAATNKEIKFMRSLQHPNTLSYYSCYKKGNEVWIVMELCEGGSVQDILEKTGQGLEEKYIASIAQQVLSGLKYLHGLQKIHRDIKSANLLINGEGKVKIADFGSSADGANRITVIGSSYWMAPETLDQRGYNTKADIWSLGITLIEMAEKDPPYFNLQPPEVIRQIMYSPPPTLKNPQKWSNDFREFVRFCLQYDPNKRFDAHTLLQHPFVCDADLNCLVELLMSIITKKNAESNKNTTTTTPITSTTPTTTTSPSKKNPISSPNSVTNKKHNSTEKKTPKKTPVQKTNSNSATKTPPHTTTTPPTQNSTPTNSAQNSTQNSGNSASSSPSESDQEVSNSKEVKRKSEESSKSKHTRNHGSSGSSSGSRRRSSRKSESKSDKLNTAEKINSDKSSNTRKPSKRTNSINENQDKIKVHLNSDSTVAKRILVEPNLEASGLCNKCQRHFKIEKSEASMYAIFVIQSSGEKKLEDSEHPLLILTNYRKEKKEEPKFIYKKC